MAAPKTEKKKRLKKNQEISTYFALTHLFDIKE
jgi:hypothetical protein